MKLKTARQPILDESVKRQTEEYKVYPPRRQPPGSPLSWSTKRHGSANKALPLIYVSSPLLPFFGWDSLNEVFVLRPKLEMPSKKSSIKTLPSSAPCRNLRCTNFHRLSWLLRLNSLVFKAQMPSKGGEVSMSSDRQGEGLGQTDKNKTIWLILSFQVYTNSWKSLIWTAPGTEAKH